MLIRRNTKTFKTILEIVTACQDRPDREKLIRLYITKAGRTIQDRISVEGIQGDVAFFYEMNYQTVLSNLNSSNHQLHYHDDIPGIYFFHSTSNKEWDETPFEFDEAIKKEFGMLADLPILRKKEKVEKFVLATKKEKTESTPIKKEKVADKKETQVVEKGPKQPGYKLKEKIHFTNLEKIIFRQGKLSKKDVLDYYDKIAEYILPYLKERPQSIRLYSDSVRNTEYNSLEALPEETADEIPDWIQTAQLAKDKDRLLLCNDKEHLLFYIEMGGLEFHPSASRAKTFDRPDYIVIGIDSDSDFASVIEVALVANRILSGLKLPSFVKTDGVSGLHVYVPLDSKAKFETSKTVAEFICKLIQMKIPALVALKGSDDNSYGKVSLDYLLNEKGKHIIAPYSLIRGELPMVATPLLWDEVEELHLENFTYETIFKRLKRVGDPFENFFRRKENADTVLERLEANYSFLF